ncbi:PREDICTED: uncharacterized protein LOC104608044 isoform X2 [Nelumbo nucifera]|nr:PREDICTED: uncharacterized protein LOC104608044 isoform X2 [Nelumbo nucifera]
MEFFNKARAIRLRSHLGKYLFADDDEETVRQSRNGSSHKARWIVEIVQGNSHLMRLKSFYGQYLTASNEPFLLGMTGKKVLQTTKSDASIEWEPIKEGFQVKLRTRGGKFLRANGGTPPWRNSITHDVPHRTATQDWVLWDVDVVEIPEFEAQSFSDYQSQLSTLSSLSLSDDVMGYEPGSPESTASADQIPKQLTSSWSTVSATESLQSASSKKNGEMEIFHKAKAVRLRSHHEKYLFAEEDEESVSQNRNGSSRNAKWGVEFVEGGNYVRLKSCYGRYLTASNEAFLLGMTGKKVLQTTPRKLDSSVEWEPIREAFQVKLRTRYGNFLRANGGVPPWRNSVTHDIPHRTATQDWILWDVDVVEIHIDSPVHPAQTVPQSDDTSDSEPTSPSSISIKSNKLSKLESSTYFDNSPPKPDGRTIYFHIMDENGNVDEAIEGSSFIFKGTGVHELKQKLEEETGIEDIIVCSRNRLDGKLYPLRLQLPPNNAAMHVVVVPQAPK